MRLTGLLAASALLLSTSALAFQASTVSEGYQQGVTADLSDQCGGSVSFASLRDGSYVQFDGLDVEHRGATGALLQRYASFPFFSFPSFVILNAAETKAYFGESSNGGVYELDLLSGQVALMTSLTFNFDMALDEASGVGYVSAATGAFGLNSVHRVDLDTFQTNEVITVLGFSGPLATDAAGDVLLGVLPDVFPFPAGSINVLRFAAADTLGNSLLTEADATVEVPALNGLSSVAHAAGGDQLVYTENNAGPSGFDTVVWKKFAGAAPEEVAVLPSFQGGLEVTDAGIGTWFGPYQPNHVAVSVIENDCFDGGTLKRVSIRGLRPRASFDGPFLGTSGQASFDLTGAPSDGFASLWIARSGALDPMDTVVSLGGLYPVALRADAADFGRRFPMLQVQTSGDLSLPFFQDVAIEGAIMAQWIVFDVNGSLVGSSNFLINRSPF